MVELELLARARALEQEALVEIHDIYYGQIFRYITMRVNSPQTAEDLTSEVFLRFLCALQDNKAPERTLRGWLYAVAFRVVMDNYRVEYRRQEQILSDNVPAKCPTPAEIVAEQITLEQVHKALFLLTDAQQNVIALRFGAGLTIRQTAETINKSDNAVKQLQLRAIAALARHLGPRYEQRHPSLLSVNDY